ncbi:BatA domain-containing protein [soil metagenome]
MNFLNPSLLFGILAISIPIILHFFNLRRIRKVEFSTLMFLKELQKTKIRRIKLRQILLLIIRCMLISFLVLAFANPVFKGMASENSGTGKNTIIFIDNSFSMESQDITGTYLSKAKQEAIELINSKFNSGKDNIVYTFSSSSIYLNDNSWNSISGSMTDSVNNISPSYLPLNFSLLFEKAAKIIENDPIRQTEIYVISDLAGNNFKEKPAYNKNISGNQGLNIYFINIGTREVNNLSIEGLNFTTRLLIPGNDVFVTAKIKNHSSYNVKGKPVTLFVKENGDKNYINTAQKLIDISSGEEASVEFTFKPVKGGVLTGYIELARNEFKDDEIVKDNKYYFSLNYPADIKAGILASGESEKYLTAALKSFSILNSTTNAESKNDIIKYENVNISSDLLKYNILYVTLDNLKDEAIRNKVSSFTDSGRTVFIFPSPTIDLNTANDFLSGKLGFCSVTSLNDNSEANKLLKIQKFDKEDDLLEGIFKGDGNDVIGANSFKADSPNINKYLGLISSGRSREIITLSNGKPLLIKSIQPGKNIFIYALSADMSYSDLPLKSIFAPVIVRAAFSSISSRTPGTSYLPGTQNIISVIKTDEVYHMSSDEDTVKILVRNRSELTDNGSGVGKDGIHFIGNSGGPQLLSVPVTKQTITPGNYILNDKKNLPLSAFSLNHDTLESDMNKVSESALKGFMSDAGVKNFKKVGSGSEAISESSQAQSGTSLWKYFIFAAILMLAGEIFLSKSIDKN